MTFIVDAQLPASFAASLTAWGHPSKAVRDLGLRDAEDDVIWSYARKNGCAILTKDEDFARKALQTAHGPPVVWLRIGNSSNLALREWLFALLPEIMDRIKAGDRLIEVIK